MGLAVANAARHLVVVNSDFDLQYEAGTVAVLDLEAVRALTPEPCGSDADCGEERRCDTQPSDENGGVPSWVCVDREGPYAGLPCGPIAERPIANRLLYPGRCENVDFTRPPVGESLIVDTVEIGAFATDVVYRERPASAPSEGAPGRLFVPVRGDATLHWIDLDENGRLDCGQTVRGGACDDRHRAGDERDNPRGLRLDPEPFAVAATTDGTSLLVTNQATGVVSLFVNRWSDEGARLEDAIDELPGNPVGVAALPAPAVLATRAAEYPPGFLVTYGNAAEVNLFRVFPEALSAPQAAYVVQAQARPLRINSSGIDSRGITVDDSERARAEAECAASAGIELACTADEACLAELSAERRAALDACLTAASTIPLDVYLANRAPASLIIGRTQPEAGAVAVTEMPVFTDTVPLTLGPSRVLVGNVIVGTAADGTPIYERRVLVVCFDSRRIVVYDPRTRSVDVEVVTGRGPHAVALDTEHGLLYVGHFTDSYIGVVSLDRRFPATYGTMLASFGRPSAPRTSQ
ncbi:MAG: hypothetical protein DIU78_022390 [Pseudomonadota bacterium]